MEAINKILRTPSAFVLFLIAIVSLVGVIITSESDKVIARMPIDATSTAEARLTELANNSFTKSPVPIFTNSVLTDLPTEIPAITPTTILSPTPSLISTNFPPTPSAYMKGQLSVLGSPWYPPTERHVVLMIDGDLYVGIAKRFAAYTYGCNTIDSTSSNIPYTVFLIRAPIEVDIIIDNGKWDHWANVYDDNFAKSLLQAKIDEVKQNANYSIVGDVECIIPHFK